MEKANMGNSVVTIDKNKLKELKEDSATLQLIVKTWCKNYGNESFIKECGPVIGKTKLLKLGFEPDEVKDVPEIKISTEKPKTL